MNSVYGICLGISLFLVASASSVFNSEGYNLSSVKGRIAYYCDLLVKVGAPYVWGGYWGILGGDCSGQSTAAYIYGGAPVKRETARGMWLGRGGWGINNIEGSEATLAKSVFPNPVFFNYKRQDDHVGIVKKIPIFYEASSSAGYYKETSLTDKANRYKKIHGYKIVRFPGD